MLTEFLRWWGRNLMAALFTWRPGKQSALGDGVIVDLAADQTMQLLRRRHGRETPLGRLTPDSGSAARARRMIGNANLVLRLGADWLLERVVHLPLAAEAQLADILRLDMDRLSPFAADEVVWSHSVVSRDPASAQITVRLAIVPRPAALATMASLGLTPMSLAARAPDGGWRVLPLSPSPRPRGILDRRALVASSLLVTGLGLAVVAVPIYTQESLLAETEASIAVLRPSVSEVEALRRGMATARDGAAALARMRSGGANALGVIATLTAALPDDTFLTELSLRGGAVELKGQSRNAARLIGLLSDDPGLQSVAFAAPVTRADNAAIELFAIRAVARP